MKPNTLKPIAVGALSALVAVAGLSASPGHATAAFPGANGKILFSTNRDFSGANATGEIYVMNADGSGQIRLTNNAVHDDDASWSPDGQKIVFSHQQAGSFDLYLMDPDGSNITLLMATPGLDTNPSWSPDGQKIAFSSDSDGDDEIFVMNADGTGLTQLTDNAAYDDEPNFSPDGQSISFTSNRDGDAEIFVMGADGSDPTNLTSNSVYDADADWSPDGQKLAWEGIGQVNLQVHVMNADGTGKTTLPGTGLSGGPVWSPDGQTIVYASDLDNDWFDMYASNADGSGVPVRLNDDEFADLPTDWESIATAQTDNVAPTVTCDVPTPTFVLGGSHAQDVTATVTDADSGPVDATVSADVAAADVSTVGVKSKDLTGEDNAGNSTTVSCPYVVGYQFGGFLEPLPQSKVKAGSAIPVKFTLRNAAGATIPDGTAQSLVGSPCRIKVTFAGQAQTGCPTYDAAANVFKFEVKSLKKTPKGVQTIIVEISAPDGTGILQTHSIDIVIV